jgi:hypothetical protein
VSKEDERYEIPDFSKTALVWPYIREHEQSLCKHWYITVKHPCGPATEVCQDCGHERAL